MISQMLRGCGALLAGLILLPAPPASAQSGQVLEGVKDGTYYTFGRKMVITRLADGGLLIKRNDEPTWTTQILVDRNGTVKARQVGLIMSGPLGDGMAGSRGLFFGTGQIQNYLGFGPDGELYYAWLQLDQRGAKIIRFSRAVMGADGAAASKLASTDDEAQAEKLLGCPLVALMGCIGGDAATAMTAAPPPAEQSTQLAATTGQAVTTGPRFALVIGNAAYGAGFGNLSNPSNDARTVGAALRRVGFQVVQLDNLDQKAMKRAIQAFGARVSAAGPSATALFYYAGHGVQSRGTNYLVPVGAVINGEADVDIEAVAADTVMRQLEIAGASTSIVILDACRNLPVQRLTRDGSRGLARMDAPNGSFVAYSTAPGSVAQDGADGNSPFARALAAEIGKPGQLIETTFRNVRRQVIAATGGKQTPWDNSSLIDSFTFAPTK